jgi:glycosyltransferase involved in cell wall biosynthesis
MKILIAHNFYQSSGGEDEVFLAESALLERYGHDVLRYTVSNENVDSYSKLALAGSTIWNGAQYSKLTKLLRQERPDLVHVHNTLPLISPSIYSAARKENVPLIQMVHNYRPFCLNGVLYRDGHVCELCIGRYPVPGVVHQCYRNSRSASAAVFTLYLAHYRIFHTYQRLITTFITSTQFAKRLLVRMGLPSDKITVKPNLVRIADYVAGSGEREGRAGQVVFVGRLESRKGVWTLLSAIEQVNIPLVLIGDGDLRTDIEGWLQKRPNLRVEMTGWLDSTEVFKRLQDASVVVFPSEFYESFGNVIAEAFACGVPVITTNMGAQGDLVEHGKTGYLFPPGDSTALANLIKKISNDQKLRDELGKNARSEFESRYTSERNYQILLDIYSEALRKASHA